MTPKKEPPKTEDKKVFIIGGGIAGLSCGIFARRYGFDVTVFEKNAVPGGNCSFWKRNGYTVDNCIHWMGGTKKGNCAYQLWEEVGAIRPDTEFIRKEAFYSSEFDGQTATLWRDTERTEKELIALSPEDEKEIKRFIKYTKIAETLFSREDMVSDLFQTLRDYTGILPKIGSLRTLIDYAGDTLEGLSRRFRHPLLRKLILDFMAKEYEAYWLIISYSLFTAGNGDIPKGGSRGVVERITETYLGLGGKLKLSSPVASITLKETVNPLSLPLKEEKDLGIDVVHPKEVTGIVLEDGTQLSCDFAVAACDLHHTVTRLLPEEAISKKLRKLFSKQKYPVFSSFQVAFAVDGLLPEVDDTLSFECKPFHLGARTVRRLTVKNYRKYGEEIAPEGKTVIQCSVVQYKEDFHFWEKCALHGDRYRLMKAEAAEQIRIRIEKRFPEYREKITPIDTWTPLTYQRRNNSYFGIYMRPITTATDRNAFLPGRVHGVERLFLAGHTLRYPGGIPTAALTGKKAAENIFKELKQGLLPENR